MRPYLHITIVCAAVFIASPTRAQSPQSNLTSTAGVLLLRNGQTLEGNITRTGDYYLVTRGVTSELRLPATSVERVCADLEALCQHKIATLERGNRQGHLALARWCLQHDLIARAADQSLMAFVLDPTGPGLDVIERRILATEKPVETGTIVADQPQSAPTLHEIEAAVAGLPAGSVQQFVTSVQPLLMNRCATNGCHGTLSDSDFKLLRPAARQALSRRMTQRNLFASLAQVDRANPPQSRLLTVAKSNHGGRQAVFSETETHQIQLLENWVAGLADVTHSNLPASVSRPPVALLQTRPEAFAELANAYSADDETQAETAPQPSDSENVSADYQPRDPFDPELFNRRYQRNATGPK